MVALILASAWAAPQWTALPAPAVVAAPAGVQIDGKLLEWAKLPRQSWTDGDDLRLGYLVAQDSDALYVVVELSDDRVQGASAQTLAERLNADHFELWLFDPTVRRPEGCSEPLWKGICPGEIVPADPYAAPAATRHIGVFRSGALHLPDGQFPPVDGRAVTAAWRDEPKGARVEIRIPREDLPFVDDLDITSMGLVLDVFDNDTGEGRQEHVYSTAPRHGWWKLEGAPLPLPTPWTREPVARAVLAHLRSFLALPVARPALLCPNAEMRDTSDCQTWHVEEPAPSFPVVGRVDVPNLTGDDRRSYVLAGAEVIELQGEIVWRGRMGGADCFLSFGGKPSGCFGAGCGDPVPVAELGCLSGGALRRSGETELLLGQTPDTGPNEPCHPPTPGFEAVYQGAPAEKGRFPLGAGAIVTVDGAGQRLLIERPCERGSRRETRTIVLRVDPAAPEMLALEP